MNTFIIKSARVLSIPALGLVLMAGQCQTTSPNAPESSGGAARKGSKEVAELRAEIAKAEKDLKDARDLKMESYYGWQEATGHKTGPSMAGPMTEPTPTPYMAEQVQMHQNNLDAARKEERRLEGKLNNLRARLDRAQRSEVGEADSSTNRSIAEDAARHVPSSTPRSGVRISQPAKTR